jgi:hypothetical protein
MKALTPPMIEVLMDCHERELMGKEPCGGLNQTRYSKGLILRGLLMVADYKSKTSGKTYAAYVLTEAGRNYLEKIAAAQNKLLEPVKEPH